MQLVLWLPVSISVVSAFAALGAAFLSRKQAAIAVQYTMLREKLNRLESVRDALAVPEEANRLKKSSNQDSMRHLAELMGMHWNSGADLYEKNKHLFRTEAVSKLEQQKDAVRAAIENGENNGALLAVANFHTSFSTLVENELRTVSSKLLGI